MALVSQELLEKAAQAQNVEELLALAKEAGIELAEEDAAMFLAGKDGAENGEISDEELDNVAGGSRCRGGRLYSSDPPYDLIVTVGNSCKLWVSRRESGGGPRTCFNCASCYKKRFTFTFYCARRSYDYDPLNP